MSLRNDQTRLELKESGVAKDPVTGLEWMIPLVGQSWYKGEVSGRSSSFNWMEATQRFGMARLIPAQAIDCVWNNTMSSKIIFAQKYRLSRATYDDYKIGRKRMDFGGYSDWRLATIDELWTLHEAKMSEEFKLTYSVQSWTANPSTKGFWQALSMGYRASWMFQGSSTMSNGFGDMKREIRYPIRLVRSGLIYNSIH